ncbi:peptide-methionine (S)-S-oxide reductase MsrA [Caenimonas soli]|uniref:peptide-methionine (S)-S-oxide reductase MsrA n=1 Tax=Caenimonas soli TaxID=2735555 RepID=UPI0015519358|nr:peptide-methionine (S)-S-oxide reductase MsrA [Caenimonas soli]NPC54522.1 peptide-methionine (S)-S-oxide reductase MsrA [Caenimonas soli]
MKGAFLSDKVPGIIAIIAVALGAYWASNSAAEKAVSLPAPAYDAAVATTQETAVFAGGCFWGVQAVFQHTAGVLNAVSGYAGGARETANYERVTSGQTGHAEAVQVTYDPRQISYGKLLQIFFAVAHDPTQLNRQGPDHGTQYRSALFWRNAGQKEVAERYIAQIEAARAFPGKIVTQLAPLSTFYPAEDYHQDYATLHPRSAYIVAFDAPKIANLKQLMPEVYREKPALVAAQK